MTDDSVRAKLGGGVLVAATLVGSLGVGVLLYTQLTDGALQQGAHLAVLGLVLAAVLGLGAVSMADRRSTRSELRELRTAAEAIDDGSYDGSLDTQSGSEIGAIAEALDSIADTLRSTRDDLDEARATAQTERDRARRLTEEVERAAEEYQSVLGAAADGDLTVRASVDTDNESMRTIGEECNTMLDEIEGTVEALRQFATDVAAASEEVTASSEEVRSASAQVSESIQQISDDASRQHQSLQSVTDQMDSLSTTTEEIAASSNEVATVAQRTAETGRSGREAAQRALAGINTIETNAESAADEIEELESEVGQIDGLIETIQEIAEQTNMLALNANIEASRSEDGDSEGFGVVAQEVKQLSEDAKAAADEIEDRLEQIQHQTDRSADAVQRTREEIDTQTHAIEDATSALEEIAGYAEKTNSGVQEISAATQQQSTTTQQVVTMVEESATVSDQTMSEAEGVAAAAEEQTTALQEVTESASRLSERAGQLSELLDRFDTDAEIEYDRLDAGLSHDHTIDADRRALGSESADGTDPNAVAAGSSTQSSAGGNTPSTDRSDLDGGPAVEIDAATTSVDAILSADLGDTGGSTVDRVDVGGTVAGIPGVDRSDFDSGAVGSPTVSSPGFAVVPDEGLRLVDLGDEPFRSDEYVEPASGEFEAIDFGDEVGGAVPDDTEPADADDDGLSDAVDGKQAVEGLTDTVVHLAQETDDLAIEEDDSVSGDTPSEGDPDPDDFEGSAADDSAPTAEGDSVTDDSGEAPATDGSATTAEEDLATDDSEEDPSADDSDEDPSADDSDEDPSVDDSDEDFEFGSTELQEPTDSS